MPAQRRPALALVREGNAGHHSKQRLERGLRLPPQAPPEPDWSERFPPKRGDQKGTAVNSRCRKVARATWRRVVPQLDNMGMLARVDEDALVDLCVCVARIDQSERQLSSEGLTMQGERGVQRNGVAIIAKGYRDRLKHLEVQFGLTPLARDAMRGDPGGASGEEEADSPFDV